MGDAIPPHRPQTLAEAHGLIDGLWEEVQRLRQQQAAAAGAMQPLQAAVRLSDSVLWDMHEEFFRDRGISAWERIPYYVTNNAYVSATYAELIVAFLLDYLPHLDTREPVYVLEMASGTACNGYYLVRELERRMRQFRQLRDLRLCYVLTDFVEENVAWAAGSTPFAPLIAAGLVDVAMFRPETDTTLRLRHGDRELGPGKTANPIIAIANYFFDCIRQDVYKVRREGIEEALYSFYREPSNGSPEEDPFQYLKYAVEHRALEGVAYGDPLLDRVLRSYQEDFSESSVIFPIGALRSIGNLLALSDRNLLLLSSDKGFSDHRYMGGRSDYPFQRHGCFSYMVNYDAIRRYFEAQHGTMLYTTGEDQSLVTVVGSLLRHPEAQLEHAGYCFREGLARSSPLNDLFHSQQVLDQGGYSDGRRLMQSFLSLIRLTNCDPIAFSRCADVFYLAVTKDGPVPRKDLLAIMDRVFDNYYPNGNQYLPAFWLGRIYHVMGQFARARTCFQRCVELRPDSANAYYNLGVALDALGESAAAANEFSVYLALSPQAEDYDAIRARVAALRGMQPAAPRAVGVESVEVP